MIADHLPRYYEAIGDNLTYTVLRSIMVDGHEVAWMQYDGTIQHDILQQGREGQSFTGRGVYCECDFIEGVGWRVADGHHYSLDGEKKCLMRQAALFLRQLELRREYQERFKDTSHWGAEFVLKKNVRPIILDLVERAKAGEFIGEDGNGAQFWGGYFYLQVVAAITDQFVGHLWEDVHALMAAGQIGLEGAVIQAYSEPPPALWEEFMRVEEDGWAGIASLPGHRKLAREWRVQVLKPDGTSAYVHLPGLALEHDPVFGPDVEDVARAEQHLRELIKSAKSPSGGNAPWMHNN